MKRTTHRLAALLIAAAPTFAMAAPPEDQQRFGAAMELYQKGHWAAAYGRFAALADRGDADAARIALQMLRYGKKLYGSDWAATPGQVERWRVAAQSGATFLVVHLGE